MPNLQTDNSKDMQEMKIKFGGETHLIQANTLINSLIHFTTVVEQANADLSQGSKKVEVKIKALPEGSFVVDFVIQASDIIGTITGLLTKENVEYASALVGTVGGIYSVAKWLKGNKPKNTKENGGVIEIENQNGEVKYFDFRGANIYINNTTVREAIAKSFDTLENDNNVTGFEILDKENNKIVEVERPEFSDLTENEFVLENTEKIITENATLNIIALDLELKKKWDFYFNGHKISAKIKDPTYIDIINKGERFGKGDSLEVLLEIKQEFSEEVNTYINKSYAILKIIKHTIRPKPKQGDMFED